MIRIAKRMQRFLTSEVGPTAIERVLMLTLIIAVCLITISALGSNTGTMFTNVANQVARMLE